MQQDAAAEPLPSAEAPNPATRQTAAALADAMLRRLTPRPWVTPAICAVIVVAFAVELVLGVPPWDSTGTQLLEVGGTFGPAFADGGVWRVVTAMFLHASVLHLALNLWVFWGAGILTERIFGSRSFLVIYLTSGVAGSLVSLAVKPLVVGVGASGAVFGVYGALLAFAFLHRGVLPAEYLARQRSRILLFVFYNIVYGASKQNIDMAAHAGGMLAGMVGGALLSRDLTAPALHETRRAWVSVGLAVALVLGAVGVRARILRVPEVRAERAGKEANALYAAKKYAEAIPLYTEAIEAHRDPSWLFDRGLAYYMLEDLPKALDDFRAADAMKSSANTNRMLCAVGLRREGSPEEVERAISHCTTAIAQTDEPAQRAEALANRAVGRALQKKYRESLDDANAALELDETQTVARGQRAQVYLMQKKLDAAEADCGPLLATEPREFDLVVCAAIAQARRDFPALRDRFDRILAIAPANASALVGRGWLNDHEGRLDEALADETKYLAIEKDDASAWNNRAWVYVQKGDFAAALTDVNRSLALRPDDVYALGTRCFANAGLGDTAGARADCVRVIEKNENENVAFYRGMLAFLDHRYGEARRTWELAGRDDAATARALAPWIAKAKGR